MKSPIERLIAAALPLPAPIAEAAAEFFETLVESGDILGNLNKAKQNLLADAADAASEEVADAILKGTTHG